MNPNLVTFARDSFRVRCFRRQTTVLLAGLTLMAGTTFVLHAQLTNIEKAVLLSWPGPAEEQIVVGADSSAGPVWTPWPEPIFTRHGELCMAVPTTASQQFFKLVSGRQFVDDFSETNLPFTNRAPYTNALDTGWDYRVTNGIYRIARQGPVFAAGYGLTQPLPVVVVRDFSASVDILDWVASGTNWNDFYIAARGVWVGPSGGYAYSGGLRLNDPGPGSVRLWMVLSNDFVAGASFDLQQNPPPYRLQFSGVGPRLSFRVLSLTTGQILEEMSVNHSTLPEGFVGLLLYTSPLKLSESYTITVDNFFVSGTKP
jgi:hypothetical protein